MLEQWYVKKKKGQEGEARTLRDGAEEKGLMVTQGLYVFFVEDK